MTPAGKPRDPTFGGVALWRRVADAIRLDIVGGGLARGAQLPSEAELAARFSVNRHTVRRGLAALRVEGVLRSEQGRGSFVANTRRLSYRIGPRTRLSEGLAGQAEGVRSELLSDRLEVAAGSVASALGLTPGSRVLRLETLSFAGPRPIARATSWFPAERFAGFASRFAVLRSITATLDSFGVTDYARVSTRISARHADADEISRLLLTPGAILLVAEAIDADAAARPIQHALSRFPAERLELLV